MVCYLLGSYIDVVYCGVMLFSSSFRQRARIKRNDNPMVVAKIVATLTLSNVQAYYSHMADVRNGTSVSAYHEELVPNRVPYVERGWCCGETNWTNMRKWPKRLPEGLRQAPMSPELFEQRQDFTRLLMILFPRT